MNYIRSGRAVHSSQHTMLLLVLYLSVAQALPHLIGMDISGDLDRSFSLNKSLEFVEDAGIPITENRQQLPKMAVDPIQISDIPQGVYDLLYRATNLTSVAYCNIFPILNGAKVGNTFDCPVEFCLENLNVYQIVKTFRPPSISLSDASKGSTGYLAISHQRKEIILVYRGTITLSDWAQDLDVLLIPYKPVLRPSLLNGFKTNCTQCRIHRGFYQSFQELYKQVFPQLLDYVKKYPDYNVVVTGHSLGGALSHVAGLELKALGIDPLVMSIAGPKIGDEDLAAYTDRLFDTPSFAKDFKAGNIKELVKGFWRLVTVNDYVPLIPPGQIWWHGGLEFEITQNDHLPQPISDVVYTGEYHYNSFLEAFSPQLLDLIDFVHFRQHISYLQLQAICPITILENAFPFFKWFGDAL